MIADDVEERLHRALDELTRSVSPRHADGPPAERAVRDDAELVGVGVADADADAGDPPTPGNRRPGWADPKLLVLAACIVVVVVGVGVAGLSHTFRRHPSDTVTTSPSTTVAPATTMPTTPTPSAPSVAPTTTGPGQVAPPTSLPIAVQSDSDMQAAGNAGPTSSVLVPTSCSVSGSTVTATGTYQGGFAPNVYNRYGDVVVLYVFGAPSAGYAQGAQLGVSPVADAPAVGSGTWQVSAGIDTSTGRPDRCVVAAQPTHAPQFAP